MYCVGLHPKLNGGLFHGLVEDIRDAKPRKVEVAHQIVAGARSYCCHMKHVALYGQAFLVLRSHGISGVCVVRHIEGTGIVAERGEFFAVLIDYVAGEF